MSEETAYPSPRSEHAEPPSIDISTQGASVPVQKSPTSRDTRPKLGVKRQQDPPRNAAGEIYCDRPKCRHKIPTFRRPCEWKQVPVLSRIHKIVDSIMHVLTWPFLTVSTQINMIDHINAQRNSVRNTAQMFPASLSSGTCRSWWRWVGFNCYARQCKLTVKAESLSLRSNTHTKSESRHRAYGSSGYTQATLHDSKKAIEKQPKE